MPLSKSAPSYAAFQMTSGCTNATCRWIAAFRIHIDSFGITRNPIEHLTYRLERLLPHSSSKGIVSELETTHFEPIHNQGGSASIATGW